MATLTLDPGARHELKIFGLLAAVFAAVYFLPVGQPRFDRAVTEALELTKWYAREHVVLCLLPAFWIAGAIAAFVSQASVMRFLGPTAPSGVFVHGAAAVLGHLPHGRGARPGDGIPLLRPGDQRARHCHDRQGARRAARPRASGGCRGVQRGHRIADGADLSQRGGAEGRRSGRVAWASSCLPTGAQRRRRPDSLRRFTRSSGG